MDHTNSINVPLHDNDDVEISSMTIMLLDDLFLEKKGVVISKALVYVKGSEMK